LARDGAAIVDVGGEATRPGRDEAVPEVEELRRVLPVIEAIVRELPEVLVSVDTVKAPVARAATLARVALANDVTALRHGPRMAAEVAQAGAGAVVMHSRGTVFEIASYAHAEYDDVVGAVLSELGEALTAATAHGVGTDTVVLDPGLGFSKT